MRKRKIQQLSLFDDNEPKEKQEFVYNKYDEIKGNPEPLPWEVE